MAKKKQGKSVLRPDGVRRLLEGRGKRLTDDQRALLLALAEVDAGTLSEEERAALDKLREQVKSYDAEELTRAVEHMVTAKTQTDRKLEWPGLKGKLEKLRKRRASRK